MQTILDELLLRHRGRGQVDLNDIAEVINARAVTYSEVEFLITSLEAEGLRVGEPLNDYDLNAMRTILESARQLRASLQRSPTVDEVATHSGYPPYAVRRALEHGQRAKWQGRGQSL